MTTKAIVFSDQAPKAIGPYSQAVKVGDVVYLSGQLPLDPATMSVVGEGVKPQALQVFHNLKRVCAAAGGRLDNIVKLTIYLTDLADFAEINDVMASFFKPPYPKH